MFTEHDLSTAQEIKSYKEHNAAAQNTSRSLSDLARSKTAFQWLRPLPTFLATSSRGSIPHLTPDNIHRHTNIPSIYIGLEDFITSPVNNSPILSIGTNLQQYLAYPEELVLVLSARRPNPVPINSSWDNKIEINTIDGHTPLPVDNFIDAVHNLHLRQKDIVISVPDVTESPGIKRLTKMVQRTQRWLDMLIKTNVLSTY
jgi:queuine tRNA-ribosyltransferase accessory subunit